jgi:Tol biopolymer transport system component
MSNNKLAKASDAQSKQRARWLYIWLLLSSFIAVPAMLIGLLPIILSSEDIANPAWSPDGTRIAFESSRTHESDIYVVNADGSKQIRLTNNRAGNSQPVWAPDGTRIAFTSERDGDREIYVMNADGSRQMRLTHIGVEYKSPVWSPDGTRIAFVSNLGRNEQIYVMNADGSQPTLLTNKEVRSGFPVWSPDGTRIAFVSNLGGNGQIYVMNADGSRLTRLTDNGLWLSPIWSPDGKRIAFVSDRDGNWEIYVMNADGSQQIRLTNNAEVSWQIPAWSPDGTRIAFGSDRVRDSEIYVINADGSHETRLTYVGFPSEFAWSPDGKRITLARIHNSPLYVMNSDGSGLLKLSIEPSFALPSAPLGLSILLPALLQLILVVGLISPQLYVRRHAQQAITLIGFRIVSSVLFIGLMSGAGWLLWLLVNGFLWLFGGIWGLRQVSRGGCWLMRMRGETDLLPRFAAAPVTPVAVPSVVPSAPQVAEPIATPVPAPGFSIPNDPSAALELGLALVAQSRREQAIACFMFVFRNGSPELRQRAVAEMEKLGEVENG